MSLHRLIAIAVLASTTNNTNAAGAFSIQNLTGVDISYCDPVNHKEIWNSKGTDGNYTVSIWSLMDSPAGYCSLGDVAVDNYDKPSGTHSGIIVTGLFPGALVHPIGFEQVWNDQWSGATFGDCAIYTMTAPAGYKCLGAAAMTDYYTIPDKTNYCCVKDKYLTPGSLLPKYTITTNDTGARFDLILKTVVSHSNMQRGITGKNFIPDSSAVTTTQKGSLLKHDTIEVKFCSRINIKEDQCIINS